jgi:GTP-binding protein HflX
MIGAGKLDDVVLRANQLGARMLIFDPDLTPTQARALTDRTELKVIDRTMLILDIFAQRARTREGKIQVELAQLRYTLPRLVEKNTMMSRLTGGIGGRGPGETKLEISRRRARERIVLLERQTRQIADQRQQQRALRQARGLPVVSIVGYTNAGKSTLLNTLTRSDVFVEDRLFATLDPTTRRLRFPRDREVIFADTVGFIRDLPDDLRQAFRATLEEIHQADLLLHVVDCSDPAWEHRCETVERLLADLGVGGNPRLLVFNKADRLPEGAAATLARARGALAMSATRPETTRPLLSAVEDALWREDKLVDGADRPATS